MNTKQYNKYIKNMNSKLDTKSGVMIGITKTKFNLQIFEQKYDDRYEGNKRLYHYEFTGPDNEKFYPVFYVERANKNTLFLSDRIIRSKS